MYAGEWSVYDREWSVFMMGSGHIVYDGEWSVCMMGSGHSVYDGEWSVCMMGSGHVTRSNQCVVQASCWNFLKLAESKRLV